jgi:hypothetical protein
MMSAIEVAWNPSREAAAGGGEDLGAAGRAALFGHLRHPFQ